MDLDSLSQSELLALSLEAGRRGDSAHLMAYLKIAVARDDATAQAQFLLGSEYAQAGLMDQAFHHLKAAVDLDPALGIARFQLGLLHLTHAQVEQAVETWQPLSNLGEGHPLNLFRQGLEHLARDEFEACIALLERGIEHNHENAALNADMQRVIEQARSVQAAAAPGAATSPAPDDEANSLFLGAYAQGKVH